MRDKTGSIMLSYEANTKVYDKTILEGYYSKEKQQVVLSDLVVWKGNPMSSS